MYESFYNLSGKPFQLSPDPRFFFSSRGHSRAMSYLRYGLGQGEGFIIITGDIGTGKTTLIRNLFSELDQSRIIAANIVTTTLEADDLLKMISSAFNLPYEGMSKAALLRQFEDFLRECGRLGKRVLLVVDEAQNLPKSSVEELRMLSNFQVNNQPLLQSFLLGQQEFRKTIQSPGMEQLRQRVIASCHLSGLDEKETEAYILHRLKYVGWDNDPVLPEESFHEIFQATNGVPRRINVFCDRLLLFGYLEELHELSPDIVKSVAEEMQQDITPDEHDQETVKQIQQEAHGLLQATGQILQSAPADLQAGRPMRMPTISDNNIQNIRYTIESLEIAIASRLNTLKQLVNNLEK
ncbi:XrtA-associated ATPase [Zooshikella marina]|uniref:DUF2075 domain-containing protein n=1 Tax=Zooshikella ganghwensis TaxID=202772 RepID=A0A4P9VN84_9GAMM|nr:XrtA/PEP-CTERM system-associated ATPase [Zooshikella ganghwensis]MBU2704443.1 XrtA-associated ATPase [Zooshikella ganghwensis]RDH44908.1 DUF2075 domain-containing protein [Zooshikella ganghwensis]